MKAPGGCLPSRDTYEAVCGIARPRGAEQGVNRLPAVLKGLLKDHLSADDRVLAENMFPGSKAVRPLTGLVT
jgi:uncharacterized protein (DUF1501 family)